MANKTDDIVEQPFPAAYIIIAIMSVIAAWLASLVAGALVTSWRSGAYLIGAAVAITGAVLVREAIVREQPSATVLAALRIREILMVLGGSAAATLVLRYIPWNPLGLVDMLLNIWFDPQNYLDWRDLLTFALLIGAWAFPIRPLDFLERLVLKTKDIPPPRRIDAYDDLTATRLTLPDLTLIHRKLAAWTVSTLMILSLVIGVCWRSFGTATHVFAAGGVLLYAALGFTLLALANFELRRSRWLIEGVTPEGETADRWAAAGGALAGGLALVAALFPAIILLALTRAIVGGILWVFSHLARAAGTSGIPANASPTLPTLPPLPFLPPPPPPQPQHHGAMPGWLIPVALAIAVLLVCAGVVTLASWLHRTGRGPKLTWLRSFAGFVTFLAGLGLALRRWWHSLRGAAAAFAVRLQRAPAAFVASVRRNSGPPGGSGAELVRYWYGQMVRQGQRAGLPRKPGQTAREYRDAVLSQVTEADEALEALTTAYIDARYSGHDVGVNRGADAQRQFQQVRQAMLGWLRRLRRGESPPGTQRAESYSRK